jgi:hypothetical protein
MAIQAPGKYDIDEIEAGVRGTSSDTLVADVAPPVKEEKPITWEDRLKAVGISVDQAHEILTQMLTKGYFEKTFQIYGGKLSVTLRSRLAWHRTRHNEALDALRSNDPNVHAELAFRYALAGSLVRIGSTTFPVVERSDEPAVASKKLDQAFAQIAQIQDSLLGQALYPLVSRFDAAVYAALSQDAPSSF